MSSLNKRGTSMRYHNLGPTGLMVSELSLGCMMFERDAERAYPIMRAAYESGVNFFDNAEWYGDQGSAEVVMGQAIQRGVQEGLWERCDLVISTKLFFGGRGQRDTINSAQTTNRKKVLEGMAASLRRMQLEYVDVVFLHRHDASTPIEETVRAMNSLVDRGLAFYWGTSEWSGQQLTEAQMTAERLSMVGPVCDQLQYNLFHRERLEREHAPLYRRAGLGTTVWSPLAGGLLTGKFNRRTTEKGVARLAESGDPAVRARAEAAARLAPFAEELGCTVAQLALAWCAANPRVSTVICGASSVAQMEENVAAVEVVGLITADLRARIDVALGEAVNTMYLNGKRIFSMSEYDESIRVPPSRSSALPSARMRAAAAAASRL